MAIHNDLAIEAEGLTKRFGDTQALAGVDLAARGGSLLGVLGPHGAGKTTAVRVLATLPRPDSGQARIAGLDVQRDAAAVRSVSGLTGQYASVDEDLTGTQNLLMIGQLLGLSTRDARTRAAELLDHPTRHPARPLPGNGNGNGARPVADLSGPR